MQVKVNAKLNLTLNVLGALNGYHIIDSVVTSVDIFDVVDVIPRADKRVTVSGLTQVATEQNTAYKAAYGFVRLFDTFGVNITIAKHIPMGAGMGGSSADAAAVVYCMCKLFDVDIDDSKVKQLCAELGSDINYMLRGGLARLHGKGDDVEYCKLGRPLYFALTTFDSSMSTAEVYSQFDKLKADQVNIDNNALVKVLQSRKACGIAECFTNHLQSATASLSDYASGYLQFCNKRGLQPNMTGSGSAYYVTFNDEQSARNACDLLNSHGFKTTLCKSVPHGIKLIRSS